MLLSYFNDQKGINLVATPIKHLFIILYRHYRTVDDRPEMSEKYNLANALTQTNRSTGTSCWENHQDGCQQ